jgi:AbrB family looped-hinge helix DNA binding protein
MKAVVADRGRVTIPKRLREKLGIRPGTILDFRKEAGTLVARKAKIANALDHWYSTVILAGGDGPTTSYGSCDARYDRGCGFEIQGSPYRTTTGPRIYRDYFKPLKLVVP